MDWTEILGLGASAMSGGLFGVIGAGVSAFFKHKQAKQEAENRKQERADEREMLKLKMEVASQGGSWDAMDTTHRSESVINGQDNYKWVVAIKSLFRPALTVILWVAVFLQLDIILSGSLTDYIQLSDASQALFSTQEIMSLIKYVVYSTVFSATTATTWWFGERALSLPGYKNR